MGAGIECDLRLTTDDRIVVFHDADAWRLCASPLKIGQSSLEDLSRLRVGEHPIPTLNSLLSLVAGQVPLLLEVKVDRDLSRWIPALKLDLAGYDGPFAVMSFDPRIPRLLKTNMPEVRRGYLINAALQPFRRRLYRKLADPDFLALEQPSALAILGLEREAANADLRLDDPHLRPSVCKPRFMPTR